MFSTIAKTLGPAVVKRALGFLVSDPDVNRAVKAALRGVVVRKMRYADSTVCPTCNGSGVVMRPVATHHPETQEKEGETGSSEE